MFEDVQRLLFAMKQKQKVHEKNKRYRSNQEVVWVDLSKYLPTESSSSQINQCKLSINKIVRSWTTFLRRVYQTCFPKLENSKVPIAEFRDDVGLSTKAFIGIMDYIGELIVELIFKGKMFLRVKRIRPMNNETAVESSAVNLGDDLFTFDPFDEKDTFRLNPDTIHFLSPTGDR